MLDKEWMRHPLQQGYSGGSRTGKTGDLCSLRLLQGPLTGSRPHPWNVNKYLLEEDVRKKIVKHQYLGWLSGSSELFVRVSGAGVEPRAGHGAGKGL